MGGAIDSPNTEQLGYFHRRSRRDTGEPSAAQERAGRRRWKWVSIAVLLVVAFDLDFVKHCVGKDMGAEFALVVSVPDARDFAYVVDADDGHYGTAGFELNGGADLKSHVDSSCCGRSGGAPHDCLEHLPAGRNRLAERTCCGPLVPAKSGDPDQPFIPVFVG